MIYLYSGTPGSGKSLHVARDILMKLWKGQKVIANFPVNVRKGMERFFYYDNSELSVKLLQDFAYKHHKIGIEAQTLLIIDECSVLFNSRDYGRKDRLDWIFFFQQHRKLGYNIILISQSDRLIDRQIRAYIEYDVKHRIANNFGFIGMLFSLFRIKLFAAVTYWYGVRERIGVDFFIFRKKYAKVYDSYKIFGTPEAGKPKEGSPAPVAREKQKDTEIVKVCSEKP